MEVAAGDDAAFVGKDERVVGRRVHLHLDDCTGVGDGIARGAVHLRHAAQRIRVLHFAILAGLCQDFASGDQSPEVAGAGLLARMRPHALEERVKCIRQSPQGLKAHSPTDVGARGEPPGVEYRQGTNRSHGLRTVDQRDTLFSH